VSPTPFSGNPELCTTSHQDTTVVSRSIGALATAEDFLQDGPRYNAPRSTNQHFPKFGGRGGGEGDKINVIIILVISY
jgi:hypothetical protein